MGKLTIIVSVLFEYNYFDNSTYSQQYVDL